MNKLLRFGRGHAPDAIALSALLDGELDAVAATRLNEHVASCEACREMLAGLRATRIALREMPDLAPTRSFRLRVADVERAPVASRVPPLVRWAPAAGAVAAAVFVAVLAADLRSSGGGLQMASAPSAANRAAESQSRGGVAFSDGKSVPLTAATPAAGTVPEAALSPAAGLALDSAASAPPAPGPAGDDDASPPAAAQTWDSEDATPLAGANTQQYSMSQPANTPTGTLRTAAADRADDDDGNNTVALRVVEMIAAVTALAAGAVIIGWRRRGVRT